MSLFEEARCCLHCTSHRLYEFSGCTFPNPRKNFLNLSASLETSHCHLEYEPNARVSHQVWCLLLASLIQTFSFCAVEASCHLSLDAYAKNLEIYPLGQLTNTTRSRKERVDLRVLLRNWPFRCSEKIFYSTSPQEMSGGAEMSGLSYFAIQIQPDFSKLSPSPTTVQKIFQM